MGYNQLIHIFKTLNEMSPLYMKDVFIQKEVTYGLRDVNRLVQPKFNTVSYGHNTIKYQRSKLCNNLPNGLKTMNSLSSFKCEIQNMVWTIVSLWVLSAV